MHSNRCWIRGSSSSRSIGLGQSSIGFLFDIGRVFFWKERYGEIFLGFARSCTKPPPLDGTTWDARRAYLSFPTLVGTGGCLLVDDGSYWSTMVSGGLDLILHCWSAGTSGAPRFRPWVAVKTSGEPSLRWTISIPYHQQHVFWLGVHSWSAWASWSAWMSGLDFPVRGISL